MNYPLKKTSILFLAMVVLFSAKLPAQVRSLSGRPMDTAALSVYIKKQMDSLKVPGAAVCIMNNNQVVYRHAFGYANLEQKRPVTEATLFEAASMTKPLFAYYVDWLAQKGMIGLDKPLYQYLPLPDLDYDPRYKKITARMVLSHTSGLPNWRADNRGQELDIKFEPGTQFSYSGEGYDYLAKVVARITHTNAVTLGLRIRRDLFIPLGMQDSYLVWQDGLEDRLATGYEDGKTPREIWKPKVVNAASSLLTTCGDYARFLSAVISNKLLSKPNTELMLSKQVKLPAGHIITQYFGWTDWALGFAVKPTAYGDVYAHGGTNEDFQSNFMIDRKTGTGFISMTNSNHGHELNKKIEALLIN
ncbi:serine hydrolase domain-containing protein [Mucilaginibacter gotjawali]|uniref:CubicO group peptidase (Beta-lactamase class C family) n=2 Tax=Mucilaginibacter gotjawali TaxID=1550579 RepID=A0A839SPF8_9SPHI|nr:serine hydrolase domain-containing protein [Mucilaginibacter gotjawali]MBB3058369.1 CubicO group peptidase (beta-lactamase class C family) [Mucilaginibacter gotjawali]BAU55511.1 Penicillin-binding protein 4* [Mucilaginibacter gotjawali]